LRFNRLTPVLLIISAVLGGCGSESANVSNAYGPPGHRFSIEFPSMAKRETNVTGLVQSLDLTNVYAYQVAAELNMFSSSAFSNTAVFPRPPVFSVFVGTLRSTSDGAILIRGISGTIGTRAVTKSGLAGEEYIGPARSLPGQAKMSDRSAFEGVLVVQQRRTLFWVTSLTNNRATASTFLASFRILQ
jgi:hypothetical protein